MGHAAIKPILEEQLASLRPLGVTDLSLRRMAGSDHASFDRAGDRASIASKNLQSTVSRITRSPIRSTRHTSRI
jgi:hypothetical protein